MKQELITLENWKTILPVGTVFKSRVSGIARTIAENTEAYEEGQGIRVKNVREDTYSTGDPWIFYSGINCEIVSKPVHTNQSYQIY